MKGTESNPRAASTRIEPQRPGEYKGQRTHDLRIGKQPAYVDASRSHLNRVLVKPRTAGEMKKICAARRSLRQTQRAMKAGTTCAYIGVITFGAEAQRLFSALEPEKQDAAYIETAEKIAERMNTTLEGLVVHADESAPHAHMSFPAYDLDGLPLTASMKRQALLDMQDILAEVMGRHVPGIERGRSRRERIEAGATPAETMHKSVRRLHDDLPADIAAKEAALAAASARVDEMRERVEKLEAKADLTDKEAKRLETYQKRLEDRTKELEAAQAEAERLTAVENLRAQEARTEAAQAEEDARRVAEKSAALLTASAAMAAELNAGTLRRTETGKVWAQNPDAMRPGLPDLNAFLQAGADAGEARHRAEAEAQKKRQQAEADLRSAKTILDGLKDAYRTVRAAIPRIRQILTWDLATEDEKRRAKDDRRHVVKTSPFLRHTIKEAEERIRSSGDAQQSRPEASSDLGGPGM